MLVMSENAVNVRVARDACDVHEISDVRDTSFY